jgi:hypothetical protein
LAIPEQEQAIQPPGVALPVINNLPEAGRATFGGGGKGFTVNVKMLDVSLPLPPVILEVTLACIV